MTKEKRVVLIDKKKVELTNESKILFPKSKILKRDLIEYYQKISSHILPFLKDRPITLFRFPNGIHKEGFVQKSLSDYFPNWIKSKEVKKGQNEKIKMVLCNDLASIVYLANQGCITLHTFLSKVDKILYPDRMIFDLDPPGKNFSLAIQAAKEIKEILEKKLNLSAFLMTTGSKGLHVLVPIKRDLTFDQVRKIAKKIAELAAENNPSFTIQLSKEKRKNKLFVDYLRNAYAQTAVCPYAVRALEKAPVATPLFWEELNSKINPQQFTIKTIFSRLQKKKDPWIGLDKKAKSLSSILKKLEGAK